MGEETKETPTGIVIGKPNRLPVIVTFPNGDSIIADVKEDKVVGFQQILPNRPETGRGIFKWVGKKNKPTVICLNGIVDTSGINSSPQMFIDFAKTVAEVQVSMAPSLES